MSHSAFLSLHGFGGDSRFIVARARDQGIFGARSASVPAVPRCPQCLVARNCTCGDGLAEFPVLAGWNDGGSASCSTSFGASFGDGIVALPRVAGPVGSNAGDVLIGWDLAWIWLESG